MAPLSPTQGLRDLALAMRPEQLGLPAGGEQDAPFGVVMDMALEQVVVTVASFKTGDASIYFSTGGGMIGGGAHESVRRASLDLVRVSSSLVDDMESVTEHPLPPAGRVYFYLLTSRGLRRGEAPYKELMARRGPLVPLFAAAQEVITQVRMTQVAKGTSA